MLKVSADTANDYIVSGKLKAFKPCGKWLILEQDLIEFISGKPQEATRPEPVAVKENTTVDKELEELKAKAEKVRIQQEISFMEARIATANTFGQFNIKEVQELIELSKRYQAGVTENEKTKAELDRQAASLAAEWQNVSRVKAEQKKEAKEAEPEKQAGKKLTQDELVNLITQDDVGIKVKDDDGEPYTDDCAECLKTMCYNIYGRHYEHSVTITPESLIEAVMNGENFEEVDDANCLKCIKAMCEVLK